MPTAPQQTPARLRTFYTLTAVLYLFAAGLFGLIRILVTVWIDDGRLGGGLPLVAQEGLCVLSLACIASLLWWVRGVIVNGYVDQHVALRRVRVVRPATLIVGVVCVLGLFAVVFGSSLGVTEKIPSIMESGLVLLAVLFTYSGVSKLMPR